MAERLNGGVKAVHLVLASAGTLLAAGGAVWGMISVHAASPHQDAVNRKEFQLLRDLMHAEHKAIERELSTLKELITK
jgi:hypothetical protein